MAMTPSLATLRAAIKLEIQTALYVTTPASVLVVHSFRRWWNDAFKFQALFKRSDAGAGVWNGLVNWYPFTSLRRRPVEAAERWLYYRLTTWQVEAFAGMQDRSGKPTEETFQDQLETVADRFRNNATIFGNREKTLADVEVADVQMILVGDLTCWRAVMSFETESLETKTETP